MAKSNQAYQDAQDEKNIDIDSNYKDESVAHRFIKGLEDKIGVPNAFGSEDLYNAIEHELEDEPAECGEIEDEERGDDYGGYEDIGDFKDEN